MISAENMARYRKYAIIQVCQIEYAVCYHFRFPFSKQQHEYSEIIRCYATTESCRCDCVTENIAYKLRIIWISFRRLCRRCVASCDDDVLF